MGMAMNKMGIVIIIRT